MQIPRRRRGCLNKAYCGNGGLPFPGMVGPAASTATSSPKITRQGYSFAQLSDGSSKTVLITESREENYTSWYSGNASYGVAAWPNAENPPRSTPANVTPATWTFSGVTGGDISLNKGDRQETTTAQLKWYTKIGTEAGKSNPHQGTATGPAARKWGPSSLHPGVVQHGWGDGRGSAIPDNDRSGCLPASRDPQRPRDQQPEPLTSVRQVEVHSRRSEISRCGGFFC